MDVPVSYQLFFYEIKDVMISSSYQGPDTQNYHNAKIDQIS